MGFLEDNLDKIILGDAYQKIKDIPDKSIDLIVTDPPYDFKQPYRTIKGHFNSGASKADYSKIINNGEDTGLDYKILEDFKRVLKRMNLYIWIAKASLPKIFAWIERNGYLFELLIWRKTNPVPFTASRYLPECEYCLFIKDKGVKLGGRFENKHLVFDDYKNMKDRDLFKHPTIKPEWIINNHIIVSSQPGDIVLDPFMGSGTTAVCAAKLNRHFLGFELDPKYFEIANDRLRGITAKEREAEKQGQGLQARLFDEIG